MPSARFTHTAGTATYSFHDLKDLLAKATAAGDEILADVNAIITSTWAASGWKVMPSKILLPPAQFGY